MRLTLYCSRLFHPLFNFSSYAELQKFKFNEDQLKDSMVDGENLTIKNIF